MEVLAIQSAVIVSKSVFCHLIFDLYSLVKNSTHHPIVQSVLVKLDLEADLKVIEALTIQLEEIKLSSTSAIYICLKQVEELVKLMRNELLQINRIVKYHFDSKWFSTMRVPNCSANLDRLIYQKTVLDKRVDLLIRLMSLIRQ
jgi:hypothetical protein